MSKKNNPAAEKKELNVEKMIRNSQTDPSFSRGEAFVEENTGSATMVNVDGRWDFDHPVYPGED